MKIAYEFIYMAVIATFLIHVLIFRKNPFIGSLFYLFMSILLIEPMIESGLGLGMAFLLISISLTSVIYNAIRG